MSQNMPAKSIKVLAKEILGNLHSRSWHQRERVAYSEEKWIPVEEVNAQLKAYFEKHANKEQLEKLRHAPFMK